MASPTLACDGPLEDSTKFVPMLFVAITNNVVSLGQESRVEEEMVGSDITTISTFSGSGTAIEYRKIWARCTPAGTAIEYNQPETPKEPSGALLLSLSLSLSLSCSSFLCVSLCKLN